VDERLSYQSDRKKIARLRQEDLPLVAQAIVGFTRGEGSVHRGFFRGTEVVEFHSKGSADVTILATDWDHILPYIQQGYFNPILVAFGTGLGYTSSFYDYVLGILRREFPDTYPTSSL
jgi:hypothetical protein